MKTPPLLAATAAVALAATPTAESADYQFIISGDPETVATAGTAHGVSAGTSLAFGVLSDIGGADALEARRRTSAESSGTSLYSTERKGLAIIIR